ncbi:MAG: flagellar motor switch protein FliN [Aquificota bacterium]|nr:MAG: flagellar motor switch protein FliN [Aquificota bacterium]
MDEEKKEDLMSMWSEALREQEEVQKEKQKEAGEVARVESSDLPEKLKNFLNIPLNVEVVVGSTTIKIGELLNLAPGSVLELEQSVEAPVDIKVNGKLIAKGAIVIVGDRFGVRIVDIITKEERLKRFL